MTGDEVAAARRDMKLSRRQFADLLGYEGTGDTRFKAIKKVELGEREFGADARARFDRLVDYWNRHRELPPLQVIDGTS